MEKARFSIVWDEQTHANRRHLAALIRPADGSGDVYRAAAVVRDLESGNEYRALLRRTRTTGAPGRPRCPAADSVSILAGGRHVRADALADLRAWTLERFADLYRAALDSDFDESRYPLAADGTPQAEPDPADPEALKAAGRYRAAGAAAYRAGRDSSYGCHYGLRSGRSQAADEYRAGWQAAERAERLERTLADPADPDSYEVRPRMGRFDVWHRGAVANGGTAWGFDTESSARAWIQAFTQREAVKRRALEADRRAEHGVLCRYAADLEAAQAVAFMAGDGIQAPGALVVRHVDGAHPLAVHFLNLQCGGYHGGTYCGTLAEALESFRERLGRFDPTGGLREAAEAQGLNLETVSAILAEAR